MKKEISKFVGSKIKEYRLKRRMTQKELGEKIGVKHNTISSYENGTNEPEQNILYLISKTLKVSINEFFPSDKKEDVMKENRASYEVNEIFEYDYYPTSISAGIPFEVGSITSNDVQKIKLPNTIMGKWARNDQLYFTRVNGESMNKLIPHNSLIAVKPVGLGELKDGDIVVYRHDNEYGVKKYYKDGDRLIFRPDSTDRRFTDSVINTNDYIELKIKGKVVLWIVERD